MWLPADEADEADEARPFPSLRHDLGHGTDGMGIGLVGVGWIARLAHLPAYRKAGFRVVAAADPDPEARRVAAVDWGIPHTYADYRDMLARADVLVVDVATPAEQHPAIVAAAAAAGKHLLVQKPFARNYAEADAMVRIAATHGVRLAVNQNARWAPAYQVAQRLVACGRLGEAYLFEHAFRGGGWGMPGIPPQSTWYSGVRHGILFESAIHYLDAAWWIMGAAPVRAACLWGRIPPGSPGPAAYALITAELANGAYATLSFNPPHVGDEPTCGFRVAATRGSLVGDAGWVHWWNSERDRGDWLEVHLGGPGPVVHRRSWRTCWFPDAFRGAMADLMDAVRADRTPLCSGADNLHTMLFVEACIRSADERHGDFVSLEETRQRAEAGREA